MGPSAPRDGVASVTFAADIDVLCDGRVVASTQSWIASLAHRVSFLIPFDKGVRIEQNDPDERWTVRFTSNPALALRNFEGETYWQGSFEMPLRPYSFE